VQRQLARADQQAEMAIAIDVGEVHRPQLAVHHPSRTAGDRQFAGCGERAATVVREPEDALSAAQAPRVAAGRDARPQVRDDHAVAPEHEVVDAVAVDVTDGDRRAMHGIGRRERRLGTNPLARAAAWRRPRRRESATA
jgi:hypothetical protein